MTGLFGRLASAFVSPAAAPPLERTGGDGMPAPTAPTVSRSVAVLARPGDAAAAGGAVALALAGLGRRPHAVLCTWRAEPVATALRAPSAPRARRLAGTLGARGHSAAARGRLVVVTLRGTCADAAAEAARVAAAAGDASCVVALAGPRDRSADALLRTQDRVVVAARAGDDAIAELAAVSLATLGVPSHRLDLPAGAPARSLAVAGLALGGPLRPAVDTALRGLR